MECHEIRAGQMKLIPLKKNGQQRTCPERHCHGDELDRLLGMGADFVLLADTVNRAGAGRMADRTHYGPRPCCRYR